MRVGIGSVVRRSVQYRRLYKTIFLIFCDFLLLFGALAFAFVLRLERVDVLYTTEVLIPGLTSAGVGVASLWLSGVYLRVLRFQGRDLAYRIFLCGLVVALCSLCVSFFGGLWMPRSIPLIQCILSVWLLVVFRFTLKVMIELSFQGRGVSTVIFGAGLTGSRLAKGLVTSENHSVLGFIDDDPVKQKTYVAGYPVWSRSVFISKRPSSKVKVLVAIPRITSDQRQSILADLGNDQTSIHFLPSYDEMLMAKAVPLDTGRADLDSLIEGRDIYNLQEAQKEELFGKRILVTGGGGSIGSELVKQCSFGRPEAICVVDLSEAALHSLDQEIQRSSHVLEGSVCKYQLLLGSLVDSAFIASVVNDFRPDIIFHAAAYKHVPIGEDNAFQMAKNNILGTANLIDAALNIGVSRFVLVSSDKAVRPTNIMGASKRVAEQLVLDRAGRVRNVEFAIVRFGNVLGSSGSVVPIFNQQISTGGPVTVTHPDVTRYFMTIAEAVSLVIEAGSMGNDQVYVLDMGEPIKISALAERLIALRGLTVKDKDNLDGDIEIEFTGLRDGEKMYEELFISERPECTINPKIFSERPSSVDNESLDCLVRALASVESLTRHEVAQLFASVDVTIRST
jgi:FlaA1/EpsC-like NDP-sugar epimerase